MEFKFKEIHIGSLIAALFKERAIDTDRALKFLDLKEDQLNKIFNQKSIDSNLLLRFSKLLEYDLFRVYTQHLVLYAPPTTLNIKVTDNLKSTIPQFRKNVYTKEIIEFIVDLIVTKNKTVQEVITQYNIPKTTVYKWLSKHK